MPWVRCGVPPPYPRIPHLVRGRGTSDDVVLPGAEVAALLGRPVLVEEKLDGANVDRRLRAAGEGPEPSRDPAVLLKLMVDLWDRLFAPSSAGPGATWCSSCVTGATGGPTTTPTAPWTPSNACWSRPRPGRRWRWAEPRARSCA